MIDIDIDTQGLSSMFNISKGDIDDLMETTIKNITAEYAYNWGMVAKKELGSTRTQYMNAIQIDSRGRFTGVAYLNPAAFLPNAIEVGMSGFDMKAGMLKSPKAKMTKNGPVLTIPFRFASAGSLGESSAFSGVLPPSIQRMAKKSSGGLKLKNIPSKYHIPKSASLRSKGKSASFNQIKNNQSTSIYEGLKKTGGGYITFRKVSLNSDPASWQHPGFTARNFSKKALANLDIPGIVGDSIDNFLTNLGF